METLIKILEFISTNILAIIVLVLVIIRTSKSEIFNRFIQQEQILKAQEQLLTEQNMTLLRMLNKIETILEETNPEKSEKTKELFQKQEQFLKEQNSLLKRHNETLTNMSEKIEILLKK